MEVARRGLDPVAFKDYIHPQEDFFAVSERYPILVVADGVTLEFDPKLGPTSYPNPSGAGEAARIFCETFLAAAEERYDEMSVDVLRECFRRGNAAVGEYNNAHGRTKESINYWDHDLFAATAAAIVIRDATAYWFSLCDAGIMAYDMSGKPLTCAYDGWEIMKRNLPADWKEIVPVERRKTTRRVYRNGLDGDGNPIGYGVVTGDPVAENYLNIGGIALDNVACILAHTDGYEEHLKDEVFVGALLADPEQRDQKLEEREKELIVEDPDKYGHERTLTAYYV